MVFVIPQMQFLIIGMRLGVIVFARLARLDRSAKDVSVHAVVVSKLELVDI